MLALVSSQTWRFSLPHRLLLAKYYIGDVDVRPEQQLQVIEYEEDLQEGQFHAVMKRRVEKYFRSNGVPPCFRSRARA